MKDIDHNTLDSLLKPIGFHVERTVNNNWCICDNKFRLSAYGYVHTEVDGYDLIALNLADLLSLISKVETIDNIKTHTSNAIA